MRFKLILVDDHTIVRAGLKAVIKLQNDLEVVTEAGSAAEALILIKQHSPDLALVDISLPDTDGITLTKKILAHYPNTKVIILSGLAEEKYVSQSILAGVRGYILKSNAATELVTGIHAVLGGHAYLSPEITLTVLNAYAKLLESTGGTQAASPLSDQELAVLRLLAQGLRTKEIALRLNIGVKTVETYRARLLSKLSCKSTNELVRYAIREGISQA